MPDTKRRYKIIDQFNGDIIASFDSEIGLSLTNLSKDK